MVSNPVPPSSSDQKPWQWPIPRAWTLLLAGLAATILGLLLFNTSFHAARAILLGAGVIGAGAAVNRRLQTAKWDLEERIESAGLIAAAAFVALLAFLGAGESWESARMLLGVLMAVAVVGALLVILPRGARYAILSVLVVVHFGGMVTAVTSVDPPGAQPPWLTTQLWARLYRPYLSFVYLTNAYHFYSPDPGPATLVWFRVQFEDGKVLWRKVPNRAESPVALHYQRMLALTESVNMPKPRLPYTEIEKAQIQQNGGVVNEDPWQAIFQRRLLGATLSGGGIPIGVVSIDELALNIQYREPQDYAKMLIASYARHVAQTTQHPSDQSIPVKRVKVYRLVHNMLRPDELARDANPYHPVRYMPYYEGEFNREGKLQDPRDPFLYWYLPMAIVPRDYPDNSDSVPVVHVGSQPPADRGKLLNGLEIHAGDVNSPTSPFAEMK